jgi:hypothetical protein
MSRLVCLLAFAASLSMSCSRDRPPAQAASAGSTDVSSRHTGATTVAHGDHNPKHGGTVYMRGDLHFEVVLDKSGSHRLLFSDAVRAELPAPTASEATLTLSSSEMAEETLNGRIDASGEAWLFNGSPLKGTDVTARVAFVVDDEPYWIDVPYLEDALQSASHAAP